jgi:hypothetical protein
MNLGSEREGCTVLQSDFANLTLNECEVSPTGKALCDELEKVKKSLAEA